MTDDLGFDWQQTRPGDIAITHRGRKATILRGDKAAECLDEAHALAAAGQQQLMARPTGNYKRGNKKLAKAHPRNAR